MINRKKSSRKYYEKNKDRLIKQSNQFRTNRDFGLYRKWESIKIRCYMKNHSSYKYYGAKGIKNLWKNYPSFRNDMYNSYLIHLNLYGRKNTTLERINFRKNYCKENCKWATIKEQANNKSFNHFYTFNNETLTISQWSEKNGLKPKIVFTRIFRGWSIYKAIFTPIL